jgi:hypothetical protein
MEYHYFAARTDAVAAAVVDWPRGPWQPPTEEDAGGLLTGVVEGVQFSQELGRFVALLVGGEYTDLEDGEHVLAESRDERVVVLRLPAGVARTIAATDADRLHGLVPEWATFEDFADPDPDDLTAFVDDLRDLCVAAVEAEGGVYSYGWA